MSGSSPASGPDRRHKVLVVDDEPSVRAMVLATIRTRGESFEVIEAGRAEEALARARESRPELVLLDVALPDRDGFWVCRELKADSTTANMLVIMLTAMGLPSDRDRALEAGADGYIVKPFSPRALLAELEQRLG